MLAQWKWISAICLSAIAALVSGGADGQRLWSFGRSLSDINAADREAASRARAEVLRTLQTGAMSAWKDEKTGHSGKVRLRRLYQKRGMPCADLDYVLKLPNIKHYLVSFCRTGNGSWRTAL
jgi:hypothetical protein